MILSNQNIPSKEQCNSPEADGSLVGPLATKGSATHISLQPPVTTKWGATTFLSNSIFGTPLNFTITKPSP